jgi:hypothetical protein
MSRKFVHRRPDGQWSKPVGLLRHMAVAAERVVTGEGPFVVTQDGDAISGELIRRKVLDRYKKAISSREIGPVFRIRGEKKVEFTGRAVVAVSSVDSTSGNSKCDVYWNWIRANFSEYSPRYAGAYVCKNIAGSSQLSQHSYGNAVDVFFDTFAHQDRVARAVVENAGELRVYHVISGQSIWTRGVGWTGYRGVYHSHLHVDFDPQQSGSCGVKG